jgi:hypothetical protein
MRWVRGSSICSTEQGKLIDRCRRTRLLTTRNLEREGIASDSYFLLAGRLHGVGYIRDSVPRVMGIRNAMVELDHDHQQLYHV